MCLLLVPVVVLRVVVFILMSVALLFCAGHASAFVAFISGFGAVVQFRCFSGEPLQFEESAEMFRSSGGLCSLSFPDILCCLSVFLVVSRVVWY